MFSHARTVAIAGKEIGIDALLRPALRRLADIERYDELERKMRQAQAAFFTRRAGRTPDQLDVELGRAIHRRQRHSPFMPGHRPSDADDSGLDQ